MLRKFKHFIKHIIYFVFFYSGFLHICIRLLKRIRKNHSAVILFYHRFGENEQRKILPYLEIKEFEKQIAHLKRLYRIITINEIAAILKGGASFPEPSVAITIDDGYKDNYYLAFPVIKKYRVPVMIYLTAGFIGTNSGLWVDDIEFALSHAQTDSLCFPELFGNKSFNISNDEGEKEVFKMLFRALLKRNSIDRQNVIKNLFEIVGVDKRLIETRSRMMLNWGEVIEMKKYGVSFGAHTMSHPFLPGIETSLAQYEIRHSKELIEKQTGQAVSHFAVPNGKEDDFADGLKDFCREIGFDTIVLTEPGVLNKTSDRFSLRRVLPPPPLYFFACETARYLFFSHSVQEIPGLTCEAARIRPKGVSNAV